MNIQFRRIKIVGMFASFVPAIVLAQQESVGIVNKVSGNCGGPTTPCKLDSLAPVLYAVFTWALELGVIIMIAFISFKVVRIVIAKQSDQAGLIAQARDEIKNMVLGLILVIVLIGSTGYIALLKSVGVNDTVIKYFNIIKPSALLHTIATPAYAQNNPSAYTASQQAAAQPASQNQALPNPTEYTTVSGIVRAFVGAMIMYIVYPCLFAGWLWSGASFVLAQGRPEAIAQAKKRLFVTFVATFVLFMVQGVLSTLVETFKGL